MSKFNERFNLNVGTDEAKHRFMNRALNLIAELADQLTNNGVAMKRAIASALGMQFDARTTTARYLAEDFHQTLIALESYFEQTASNSRWRTDTDEYIRRMVDGAEVDLGVRWKDGKFWPAGAKELDNALINEPYDWLRGDKYQSVRDALKKSLEHLLQTHKNEGIRNDVITDAYEALESMAKIVTGKEKDLSGNAELFVSRVSSASGLGPSLKALLKEYVSYGNEYRHGPGEQKRKTPTQPDTEAFLYLTGIFIRLAQEAIKP